MANIPQCPNTRDKACERSALRLVSETENSWQFFCETCKLCWMVSKPRNAERARWENAADRIKRMTDEERAIESRTKYFVMPGGR